ncbi:MAG: protease modulator HflC [Acidobacteriota bacterium]|nr:MAG: protease modulator HflC [Acidobacteriota bacterium]
MTRAFVIVVALFIIFVVPGSMYVVHQTEQAIITQFGEPVGDAITTPGLHFKLPWIQKVLRFDKRWLPWDGDANQIPTKDKKFIWVDTYARWRIADPLAFYTAVRNERQAQSRLDDIIDGETRNAVASYNLIEIVRSSDREFEVTEELGGFIDEAVVQEIVSGRDAITRSILQKASLVTPNFGIELVDVQFKRINYTEEVRESVYQRMISERRRIAEQSRSEGQGRSAEIRGQKERDLQQIESEAFKTAEETRGLADAEATQIYASAYSKDPDFYQFLKTLETYRSSLDKDATLVLSSNSEFLKFLKSSR